MPWTWSDYAGYRDTVNATGTGINLAALVGHSPIRLVGRWATTRGRASATDDEIAAMAAMLRDGDGRGRVGAVDVVPRRRPARADPCRPAPPRAPSSTRCSTCCRRAGRGLVEVVPGLLGPTAMDTLRDLGRRCGKRGIPLTWTGFTYVDSAPHRTQRWLDLASELAEEGIAHVPAALAAHRRLPPQLGLVDDVHVDARGLAQGGRGPRRRQAGAARDPEWRAAARDEWDRTKKAMFPIGRLEVVRFVEVVGAENERWLGRTLADLVAERGGHPSDVFADFVLANDCRPGLVAVGHGQRRRRRRRPHPRRIPHVLISSSDSGAHMQMMCASGDTTLLLTRHVRDRGDFTLEDAVYQLTGRQADVFGFHRRGVVAPGNVADLTVFALDELTTTTTSSSTTCPGGGVRLRRPRAATAPRSSAARSSSIDGERTGALPGRVISSIA